MFDIKHVLHDYRVPDRWTLAVRNNINNIIVSIAYYLLLSINIYEKLYHAIILVFIYPFYQKMRPRRNITRHYTASELMAPNKLPQN